MSFKIDIKTKIEEMKKDIKQFSQDMEDAIYSGAQRVSVMVYNKIRSDAKNSILKSTKEDYIKGLEYQEIDRNVYQIFLKEGSMAAELEGGWDSFDMKPGMLASSKAKKGKNGPYFDVPFKHSGKNYLDNDTKQDSWRSLVANVVRDKTVEKVTKKYSKDATGINKFGDITRYKLHKHHPLNGLVNVKKPGSKSGGKYFIFRRVSSKTPQSQFIHPGFQGINIFNESIYSYASNQIDLILNKILG